MENYNRERFREIKKNRYPRYHFIESDSNFKVPELVVDFKHYAAIQREWIYSQFSECYFASLKPLFREALSQRFAYYISRIGLPEHGKQQSTEGVKSE